METEIQWNALPVATLPHQEEVNHLPGRVRVVSAARVVEGEAIKLAGSPRPRDSTLPLTSAALGLRSAVEETDESGAVLPPQCPGAASASSATCRRTLGSFHATSPPSGTAHWHSEHAGALDCLRARSAAVQDEMKESTCFPLSCPPQHMDVLPPPLRSD